jgi:endonuclease G
MTPSDLPKFDDVRRDRLARALARGNPLLAEMGINPVQFSASLNKGGGQLESAHDRSFLEALVKVAGRPPLVVQNDKVLGKSSLAGNPAQNPDDFPATIGDMITAVEGFLPLIGRVEFSNHSLSWGGTGWIIGKDSKGLIMATNRHVAALVARRTATGEGVFLFSPTSNARYKARLDTVEEANTPRNPDRVYQVERFTYLADDAAADVALARLILPAGGSAGLTPIPLSTDKLHDGELVGIVGYPASDPYRNDPTAMERYFRGLYDVKRFSPGKLLPGEEGEVLSHDCTTLGGNSGSPLISLEKKAVVGLHFAGEYGVGNSAVRAATLQALLDGQSSTVPGTALPVAEDEGRRLRHDAAHFAGRTGYDAGFLQVADVPLPVIPDAFGLAAPDDATPDRPFELRYQHFSVLYSTPKKGPVVGALNIDGSQTRALKRRNTTWTKDLRLPEAIQLDAQDYGDDQIDRGHIVRRAATNWGESDAVAKQADADSFHYTVCSPQHSGLNRNDVMWLGLEDYVLSNTRTHGFRACVFAGPVFTDDDPPLGTSGAPIPLNFWKVVTMLAMGEDEVLRLHATAYVLSQGPLIADLLARRDRAEAVEGFVFGAFRTYQVQISDLAAMTGYDFGPLVAADPLARAVGRIETQPSPVKPLGSFGDIVL